VANEHHTNPPAKKLLTGDGPPPPASPAARLTQRYWELLGKPPTHIGKRFEAWPQTFGQLLNDYPESDLMAAIEWAFLADTFWPSKLATVKKEDPVEYFHSKAYEIVPRWRLAQKTKAADAPPPINSKFALFKNE
jgi:hypothetical protein